MTAEIPIPYEIPEKEAAQEAARLIQEFKAVLWEIPEFGKRAAQAFLGITDKSKDEYPHSFKNTIFFRSGDSIYSVFYERDPDSQQLIVSRHPSKKDAMWGWQQVDAVIMINGKDPGPPGPNWRPWGTVQYSKIDRTGNRQHELYTNNQMAIEKIRSLLQELAQNPK